MEYTVGMIGRYATLARLRKSRRLPLTEAAYNGHYEVLQVRAWTLRAWGIYLGQQNIVSRLHSG